MTVIEGNNQNFTITPNTGYHIADVRVDGQSVGTKSDYEFSQCHRSAHDFGKFRSQYVYDYRAQPGSNGSITPGTVSVAQGSGKTFTIAADSGYEIADVVVDNISVGRTADLARHRDRHQLIKKHESLKLGLVLFLLCLLTNRSRPYSILLFGCQGVI